MLGYLFVRLTGSNGKKARQLALSEAEPEISFPCTVADELHDVPPVTKVGFWWL